MSTSLLDPRSIALARKAKRKGMSNSLRIVVEAERAGIPISLAFAMIEQESSTGRNIWGGDPAPNGGTSNMHQQIVTKNRYKRYRDARGSRGQGGMQGVGPMQLTWWEFQDMADRRGGCWVPKHNIATGFSLLAGLIRQHGRHDGVKMYNGSGAAAERYAASVLSKQKHWHKVLS